MLRILPLLLIVFLFNCKSQKEASKETEGERVIKVSVVSPQKEEVEIYYTVKGSFEAVKEVYLKPEVSGIVEKIFTDEGRFVKEGEKLLKIEDKFLNLELKRLEASYRELLANLEYYRAFYERRKNLYERELISKESFEEAGKLLKTSEEEVKALQAQIQDAKLRISKSTVRAPFSGYVAKRFVSEGDYVNPSTNLFHIVSLNPIRLSFSIPQEHLSKLEKEAIISAEVEGVGEIKGKVSYLSPVLTQERTITVKADFQNPEGKIKPGMFAIVKLLVGKREAFKVPEQAITLLGNKKVVWKVENGRAVPVEVELLKTEGGYAYVLGNLKEDDKIAVENAYLLRPGAKVSLQ